MTILISINNFSRGDAFECAIPPTSAKYWNPAKLVCHSEFQKVLDPFTVKTLPSEDQQHTWKNDHDGRLLCIFLPDTRAQHCAAASPISLQNLNYRRQNGGIKFGRMLVEHETWFVWRRYRAVGAFLECFDSRIKVWC